jgi:hypothetical protein
LSELTSNVQTETVRLSKQTNILLFINDVPTTTSKNAKLVSYTDNTSKIITSPNSAEFSTKVNTVFADINEWFRSNLLSLNADKNHFLQFQTKNSQKLDFNNTLLNKHIMYTTNIKSLGLTIDETLSWKCHINHRL